MTEDMVLNLGHETIKVTAMVAAPLLLSTLVIGVIVSIIQAVTQINEATLTFIPKMLVVGVVVLLAGPWMLDMLMQFTTNLFENITLYVRE
jgi:flagellar biosynthetic protein FliQ